MEVGIISVPVKYESVIREAVARLGLTIVNVQDTLYLAHEADDGRLTIGAPQEDPVRREYESARKVIANLLTSGEITLPKCILSKTPSQWCGSIEWNYTWWDGETVREGTNSGYHYVAGDHGEWVQGITEVPDLPRLVV